MTVAAQNTKIIYPGDDQTTVFAIPFDLPAGSTGSDVKVAVVDNDGNITTLTSNYTVDTSAMEVTYPVTGGTAPLAPGVNALPANWQIVIYRIEALVQDLNLVTGGAFSASAIMAALDWLTMITQQFQEQLNRCIMVPINVPEGSASPVIPPSTGILPFYGEAGNLTYAAIKLLAEENPTQAAWGMASDYPGVMFFYCANTAVGDEGWTSLPMGSIGG